MFLIDLLHEIELCVWKALFIHLLRMLASLSDTALHELDRRYSCYLLPVPACPDALDSFWLVPTFGRDTIRRFTSNTSDLKKMAARNYEDFLQVIGQCLDICSALMFCVVTVRDPCF
jgi:hypothetical protein